MRKIALIALVAPLVLAACGGSSGAQVKVDPVAFVKHAARKTAQTSEHATMTAKMNMGPTALSMSGSGDFSFAQHDGSMRVNASVLGQSVQIQEILAGTTIYMRSPLFSGGLPAGKTWVKLDLAQVAKAAHLDITSMLSQSPAQNLQRLEGAGTVTEVGAETINGVGTTHYRVTNLDASELLPGAKLGAQALPGKFTYGPVDVWIGKSNGYVTREALSFNGAAAGHSVTMTMVANYSKFGEAVHVTVPPASQTADAAQLGMSGVGA
jgi:hypothetical protein